MLLSPRNTFQPDDKGRIKLRWESFAYLPRGITEELYATKEPVEILLNECDIIGHDGLLWILSVAHWRKVTNAGPTHVHLPRAARSISLIRDLRFPNHLIDAGGFIANESVLWFSQGPEYPRSRLAPRRESPFSPRNIQYVDSSNWGNVFDAVDLFFATDVADLLQENPLNQMISEHALPFRKTIQELILNLARHGGPSDGAGSGYVCYRPWPRPYPILRFCCNDFGPGFSATLPRHSKLRPHSETEALHDALLYRYWFPSTGVLGFYNALPFIHRLKGRLHIRSMDASIRIDLGDPEIRQRYDAGYKKPTRAWVSSLSKAWPSARVPGCHIALDLQIPDDSANYRT